MRAAALDLIEEMVRWMTRAPFESMIESLREATKKDIDERLGAITPSKREPTIGLRSEQTALAAKAAAKAATAEAAAGSGGGGGGGEAAAEAEEELVVDAWEFTPEVDLVAAVAKSDFDTVRGGTGR